MFSKVLLWNVALTLPDGRTHIQFIDAGGAATFVRTPNGTRVLIDGGANPSAVVSTIGRAMPFWERRIDMLILTDASDDHLAGMIAVLERYDVRQVVQANESKQTVAYRRWSDVIAQKQLPNRITQIGTQIELDRGVTFEIVYPNVARLRVGDISLLFADSAEESDQSELASQDIAITILIAPHKLSSSFYNAVSPSFAILFIGTRDKLSEDLLTTLENSTVLRTDERGTIEMVIDGNSLIVR